MDASGDVLQREYVVMLLEIVPVCSEPVPQLMYIIYWFPT